MTDRRTLLRRLKLRHVLLVVLLLSGIIPLAISSFLLIPQSQQVLRDTERDNLVRRAGALSRDVDAYLGGFRRQLAQLGAGLLLPPGPAEVPARLREPWVSAGMQSFLRTQQAPGERAGSPGTGADLQVLRVLDLQGAGPIAARANPGREGLAALDAAFQQAVATRARAYRFVDMGPGSVPMVALAVPATLEPGGAPQLVVEALLRFKPLEVLQGESGQGVGVPFFPPAPG